MAEYAALIGIDWSVLLQESPSSDYSPPALTSPSGNLTREAEQVPVQVAPLRADHNTFVCQMVLQISTILS
jgi:hypothetical protein